MFCPWVSYASCCCELKAVDGGVYSIALYWRFCWPYRHNTHTRNMPNFFFILHVGYDKKCCATWRDGKLCWDLARMTHHLPARDWGGVVCPKTHTRHGCFHYCNRVNSEQEDTSRGLTTRVVNIPGSDKPGSQHPGVWQPGESTFLGSDNPRSQHSWGLTTRGVNIPGSDNPGSQHSRGLTTRGIELPGIWFDTLQWEY